MKTALKGWPRLSKFQGHCQRAKLHLKVAPLTALDHEQMQHVTWEGSTTILQKEEGFCQLLPVTIHSLSWLNCSSVQKVQLLLLEFMLSCLVPPASLKFSRQYVSQEVLDQLGDFLSRDDVSRPSSCRSVVIEGKECPVRYWQDSIKQLVRQYQLEFPNGGKRSYIYAHIPKNFRSNTMLAGLCNIYEDYGFSNFAKLRELVQGIATDYPCEDLSSVIKMISGLQRYLKTKFSNQVFFFFFFSSLTNTTVYW